MALVGRASCVFRPRIVPHCWHTKQQGGVAPESESERLRSMAEQKCLSAASRLRESAMFSSLGGLHDDDVSSVTHVSRYTFSRAA